VYESFVEIQDQTFPILQVRYGRWKQPLLFCCVAGDLGSWRRRGRRQRGLSLHDILLV
jgi:hypothetical protein